MNPGSPVRFMKFTSMGESSPKFISILRLGFDPKIYLKHWHGHIPKTPRDGEKNSI